MLLPGTAADGSSGRTIVVAHVVEPVERVSELLLIANVVAPTPTARPTATPKPPDPDSDVVIRFRAPDQVQVGDRVTLDIRLENQDRGDASKIFLDVDFDSSRLRLEDTDFEDPSDWVTEIGRDDVRVEFGELEGRRRRDARLFFRAINDGTVTLSGNYDWEGEDSERRDTNIRWVEIVR
jgi:hypothetical protein